MATGLNWFQVLNSGGLQQPLTAKAPAPKPEPLDPRDFGLGTRGRNNTIIAPQQWTYADLLRNNGEFQNYNGNPYLVWDQFNSNMNNYQQAQLDALNKQQQQPRNTLPPGMNGVPGGPAIRMGGGMGGGQGLGAQRRQDRPGHQVGRGGRLTGGLGGK